jgi:hypothetical protein
MGEKESFNDTCVWGESGEKVWGESGEKGWGGSGEKGFMYVKEYLKQIFPVFLA